jgi:glycosyltransferase involved in cell wall biosynthesis
MTTPPRLSIVIPAYNEAARIAPSLESILSFIEAENH